MIGVGKDEVVVSVLEDTGPVTTGTPGLQGHTRTGVVPGQTHTEKTPIPCGNTFDRGNTNSPNISRLYLPTPVLMVSIIPLLSFRYIGLKVPVLDIGG